MDKPEFHFDLMSLIYLIDFPCKSLWWIIKSIATYLLHLLNKLLGTWSNVFRSDKVVSNMSSLFPLIRKERSLYYLGKKLWLTSSGFSGLQ